MGQVLVANGLETATVLRVGGVSHEIRFKDHLALLRQLLGLCDACLLEAPAQLRALGEIARWGIEYVHLAEHQIERMCWYADAYKRDLAGYDGDIDVGLGHFLNTYAVPAAGNRDIRLTSNARYFIKVS